MLSLLTKLIMALGGKKLLKLAYKIMIRPELVNLASGLDPDQKTELDENAIKLIDKVVEGL